MKTLSIFALGLYISMTAFALPKGGDHPAPASAAKILDDIKKMNTLGSVLYLAAHPDDENTRLISWLANNQKVRTGYLSLTRGDGGQNLIGTEKGELIGVLRTQELLEARKIDGGMQYFTRAVDFGYSKTTKETLEKWNEREVLWDIVWVIRRFRPDVIITRFPATQYAGHGHHSASAVLAEKAFEMAADPSVFPDQLKMVTAWRTKRLYHNTSSWWNKEIEETYKTNPDMIRVDVGAFNPITGKWNNQIAMESRSQHKSQGFGASILRGEQFEYLEYVKGEKANNSIFDNIDISWGRVPKSDMIQTKLNSIIENFKADNPAASVIDLVDLYRTMEEFPKPSQWIKWKKKELENIIVDATGLWFEAVTENEYAVRGEVVKVEVSAINTGQVKSIAIEKASLDGKDTIIFSVLAPNNWEKMYLPLKVAKEKPITHPYWLMQEYQNMFKVDDILMRASPENTPAYEVTFQITVYGVSFDYSIPVQYKFRDRVSGENIQDFSIRPDMTLNLDNTVYVVPKGEKRTVTVTVMEDKAGITGKLTLNLPEGWTCSPESHIVTLNKKEAAKVFAFDITAGENARSGDFSVQCKSGDKVFDRSLVMIDYPHIHKQTLFPKTQGKLVTGDLTITRKNIGYVMGAGDNVPEAITQLGGNVTIVNPNTLAASDLSVYDVLAVGIRAYNTQEALISYQSVLMAYVNQGGLMIVQYNTNRGLKTENFGPYPLKLSRDRVTDEFAKATILNPKHPIILGPNPISDIDFDNWVQERGLYFANQWDENYEALISWSDPGEDPSSGALLAAKYGKGHFVFTGISFFRQLPAGVPGAYKLFANILSYGRK
ncbi:MAG: LmbE family protein [Crocinitomicaceae bacterium]|nr:LmbE family protein [Crocinitomicaceae bacterium]